MTTERHYPYPTFERDGFQLAVVRDGDQRVTASPIPSEDERFEAKPGDTVKLIFEYQEVARLPNGNEIGSEHMWVEIVDCGEGCLKGRLDNSPLNKTLLSADQAIAFHPLHIIAFESQVPGAANLRRNGGRD